MLREAARQMRAHGDELARLLTLEEGKPLPENEEEMEWVIGTAEEAQAGAIWINDPLTDNYGGPFGGMKMSDNARELGLEIED